MYDYRQMPNSLGDLKPERGTNANIGLMYDKKIGSGLLQVEVNGFFSYLQDMIRYTRNFVQGRYTNFGEMRTFGVEAEVKADVTRWLYGYVNATFQDLRDTRKYQRVTFSIRRRDCVCLIFPIS